jgi:hypothetical protein
VVPAGLPAALSLPQREQIGSPWAGAWLRTPRGPSMRSRTLIANLAAEHRKRERDPRRIAELREQIREAQLTEWVERQLAAFPPLSQATRDRLASLLSAHGVDQEGGDGHSSAA